MFIIIFKWILRYFLLLTIVYLYLRFTRVFLSFYDFTNSIYEDLTTDWMILISTNIFGGSGAKFSTKDYMSTGREHIKYFCIRCAAFTALNRNIVTSVLIDMRQHQQRCTLWQLERNAVELITIFSMTFKRVPITVLFLFQCNRKLSYRIFLCRLWRTYYCTYRCGVQKIVVQKR